MTSRISPCQPWATAADLPDTCTDAAVTPTVLARAFAFATDVLFNLTKRRWTGECADEYRPSGCLCNVCTAGSNAQALMLPAVRVRAITEVRINGDVVDPATYQLRDGRYLWRLRYADGTGATWWPCWQDLTRMDEQRDSFVVAYTYGQDPPPSMRTACAALAWELALGWTPSCANSCRLPKNITSMTRGGITTSFPDPASLFADGRTHVPEVDMLVAAVNRGEAHQRSMVAVPGRAWLGNRDT